MQTDNTLVGKAVHALVLAICNRSSPRAT